MVCIIKARKIAAKLAEEHFSMIAPAILAGEYDDSVLVRSALEGQRYN